MSYTLNLNTELEFDINDQLNKLKKKEGRFITKQFFLESLLEVALEVHKKNPIKMEFDD